MFNNLPMGRKVPIKSAVSSLLIHAKFIFCAEDFNAVSKFLNNTEQINNEFDLHNNFYFNRDLWRQRVRMYTHNASDHAKSVRVVHNYVQKNETCREYYTNNVREYFKIFEKKAQQGYFEELDDVHTFYF